MLKFVYNQPTSSFVITQAPPKFKPSLKALNYREKISIELNPEMAEPSSGRGFHFHLLIPLMFLWRASGAAC
ncbi:unnamed protein product [Ilex paraguariensis]|uniref:Uncharacterized protein n=1 Tax=Ilex paraguariensis TaxID=185542 RepID=A0ABC8SW47_9AQUA